MNEQQLADLFSEQIDRLLAGEPVVSPPAAGNLQELFTLGQQLAQVSFQPSPLAQAAFQSQLVAWFGPANGGLFTAILGTPRLLLLAITGALVGIGAGLGLVTLVGSLFTGTPLFNTNEHLPGPQSTGLPPQTITRPVSSPPPATGRPASATPPGTRPAPTASMGDRLPSAAPSLGDTLPSATPTPTTTVDPAGEDQIGDGSGNGSDSNNNGDDGYSDAGKPQGNVTNPGDHDRGHGNEPDGYDEDNPGNSSGPAHEEREDNGQGNSGGGSRGGGNQSSGSKGGGKKEK